ncbi:hypothetical protein TRAPUB_11983 [Trametes pubescens]|uniref:CCHC-type domain-containing protein n=1 Tax=Trametes pubescens TaxID=154538 RepID=A0A1M2VVC8_TRAPU|nr:hypothetical protein TRAPUB_11983 [Trametes pubescens]
MTAPPGWDQYESTSQAPYRDHTLVTLTANPRQFALQPRWSLAPGASAHPGLSLVPEHDPERLHELAYTGPSYGPCDTREVRQLLGMINEMVGEEPTSSPPAYLKVTKITLPKLYNGKDDLDTFEIWFHNLLEFFRTLQITGPSMDRDQLRILGDCLSEDTTTWMYSSGTGGLTVSASPNDHCVNKPTGTQVRRPVPSDPSPRMNPSMVKRLGPPCATQGRTDRPRPNPGQVPWPAIKPAATKAASQCFSCGKIGRFASDPSCPNFGKKTNVGQRMFAHQVESNPVTTTDPVEDEHQLVEQTEVVQDLPQSEYDYIGSQYESEDEQVQSDWDEYEYDHTAYTASMRIEALASGG